jgi:hypothetical protein
MCPDIAFTVTTVAHFTSNPRPVHWEAIKQIFCYLAGMQDLWLLYSKSKCTLEGYADVNSSMAKDRYELIPLHQRMAVSCIHISNKYRVPEMATRNPNPYSTSHQVIQTLRTYQRLCITPLPS